MWQVLFTCTPVRTSFPHANICIYMVSRFPRSSTSKVSADTRKKRQNFLGNPTNAMIPIRTIHLYAVCTHACSTGACWLRQGGQRLGERSIEQVAAHRFPAVFPVLYTGQAPITLVEFGWPAISSFAKISPIDRTRPRRSPKFHGVDIHVYRCIDRGRIVDSHYRCEFVVEYFERSRGKGSL